jgi:hypothetical protein
MGCAAGWRANSLVWLRAPGVAAIMVAIAIAKVVIAIRENLDMMLNEVPRTVPIE